MTSIGIIQTLYTCRACHQTGMCPSQASEGLGATLRKQFGQFSASTHLRGRGAHSFRERQCVHNIMNTLSLPEADMDELVLPACTVKRDGLFSCALVTAVAASAVTGDQGMCPQVLN